MSAPLSLVEQLRLVVDLKGYSLRHLGRELDVHPRSVLRWLQGGADVGPDARPRVEAWLTGHADALEPTVENWADLVRERTRPGRRRLAPLPPPPEDTDMEITPREYLDPEHLLHYGLSADPFDDPADPERVFLSSRLQAVEAQMDKAVQRRSLIAVVATPGAGKSTLLRRAYARYARQQRVRLIAPASNDRRRITHAALAVAILRDLTGRDTSSLSMEARDVLLRDELARQATAGAYPTVVIDEAHRLPDEGLIAIKHLWDSHTLFQQLAVLMIGQLPLETRLRQNPALAEVTGRTRILQLGELGAEVPAYLRWRFDQVGAKADAVFAADAYQALAVRGKNPLFVNNKAVAAMKLAHRAGDTTVTAQHVTRA